MRRTVYNDVLVLRALSPAVRTNGATNGVTTNTVQNGIFYPVAMLAVVTGTMTDGTVAVTIEDSADAGSNWAAVPAARLQGSLPTVEDTGDDTRYETGVIVDPGRPHIRCVSTTSGATSGGALGAVWILGGNGNRPVVRS
jgi:hypothetical protein